MLVGYARTSTYDQVAGFEDQVATLTQQGCDRIFKEQVSSVTKRPELERAIEFVREGDVFVVTKLDRLARSVVHLEQIKEELERKGVQLRILDLNIDTATATGQLMLNLIGSIAQFERQMMLERQRAGVARAKREGKYKGRKPVAQLQRQEIKRLVAAGMTREQIASELGISARSVYRVLAS